MSTKLGVSKQSIETPDEVREFDKGRMELVTIGDLLFARAVFQPGWKWSESVKPIAQTSSCEFSHRMYVVSGSLHIRMDDGTELEVAAGDVVTIDPGHDAWVIGGEPCVMYDFGGNGADYAKPRDVAAHA
jgi:uncharacterized cupin superfamily protein